MTTNELKAYIKKARREGDSDETIRGNLILAGWSETLVEAGLHADLEASDVPKPPDSAESLPTQSAPQSKEPIAVVQTFSPRGFEYIIMFIALGVSAFSLGAILHDLATIFIVGTAGESSPMATAGLLVAFPVFAFLFLRLKKLERAEPKLQFDTSRRRAVQLTLIVSFVIGIGRLMYYIYQLLDMGGTSYESAYASPPSTGEMIALNTAHALITILIAGGIFGYYWFDLQHREDK